jgi:hypothetical protein
MTTWKRVLIVCAWLGAAAPWAVSQPPPVTFNHLYDFSNGLQGWTITSNPNGAARWVDPAVDPQGPVLPNSKVSGAGAGNLYLPDGSAARLHLADLGLQNGTNRFVLQMDIYIPNLRPLGMCERPPTCKLGHDGSNPDPNYGQCFCDNCSQVFVDCGYAGNMNDRAGIMAVGPKSLSLIGDINNARQTLWDSAAWPSHINDCPGPLWVMEQYLDACHTSVYPYNDFPLNACWWNQWITVYLDYNWSSAGRIIAWARIPWTGGRHDPRFSPLWPWVRILGSDDTGIADPQGPRSFTDFIIGYPYMGGSDRPSWTQSQFGNAKIALPEHYYLPEVCNDRIDNDGDGLIDCLDPDCFATSLCPVKGDFDHDGDVDQADFGHLQLCFSGSFVPQTEPACQDAELDGDDDVDQADLSIFMICATGSGAPADHACGY